jgi:hypothetical protein
MIRKNPVTITCVLETKFTYCKFAGREQKVIYYEEDQLFYSIVFDIKSESKIVSSKKYFYITIFFSIKTIFSQ